MSIKPNTQELEQTARTVGLEIGIMDTESSDNYIKRVIETFKPFKSTGHLAMLLKLQEMQRNGLKRV